MYCRKVKVDCLGVWVILLVHLAEGTAVEVRGFVYGIRHLPENRHAGVLLAIGRKVVFVFSLSTMLV